MVELCSRFGSPCRFSLLPSLPYSFPSSSFLVFIFPLIRRRRSRFSYSLFLEDGGREEVYWWAAPTDRPAAILPRVLCSCVLFLPSLRSPTFCLLMISAAAAVEMGLKTVNSSHIFIFILFYCCIATSYTAAHLEEKGDSNLRLSNEKITRTRLSFVFFFISFILFPFVCQLERKKQIN